MAVREKKAGEGIEWLAASTGILVSISENGSIETQAVNYLCFSDFLVACYATLEVTMSPVGPSVRPSVGPSVGP